MDLRFEKIDKNNYITFCDNIEVGTAMDNWDDAGNEYQIDFNTKIFEFSIKYKIADFFKENIGAFTIPLDFDRFTALSWCNTIRTNIWYDENKISFYGSANFLKWNKSFDFISFLDKLRMILIPYEFLVDFKNNDDLYDEGFIISSKLNLNKSISEEFERFILVIDNEIKNIFENPNLIDVNSIINKFSFPQEARQACEQYLIYFSKFLEDYGIEITSVLESKNEDTFFSIKPKNSKEALSNIRDLLNFYLSLPDIQNLEITIKDYNDVSVQQLMSNIYHLKSQLFLAHSIIESKNATIESLKFSNFQKQVYIEQNLKNEEKTLDGLVTIQEFEYGSFKFDLPEIFRRLKRRFTK